MKPPTTNKKKSGKKTANAVTPTITTTTTTTTTNNAGSKNNYHNGTSAATRKLLEKVMEHKVEGNAAFVAKDYPKAVTAYNQGFDILKSMAQQKTHSSCDAVTEATVQLYSNRAMVWIRSRDYTQAETDCNTILNDMQYHQSFKVWYRRALAREGLASQCVRNCEYDAAETYVLQAKEDLHNCLVHAADSKEMETQKKTVLDVAMRLGMMLTEIEKSSTHNTDDTENGDHYNHTVLTEHHHLNDHTRTEHIVAKPVPVVQQREDVIHLLQRQQTCSQNNNGELATAAHGEAFFLVEWEWWCDWCAHVQFFGENDTESSNQHLLSLLPAGAVRPDDPFDGEVVSPGPIDNAELLLPHPKSVSQNAFYKHWYQEYHANYVDDAPIRPALKPCLVRGHDFEVLPREVYNALLIWYSELTPPICRRATLDEVGTLRLTLYPLYKPNFERKEMSGPCSACGAPGASMRCRQCMSAYYCDRGCQENDWKVHKIECKASGKNGNGVKVQRSNGRTGLNNLGNTCFMNSALQSLSHATPLTRHFLSGRFKADVNDSNPLGTGGRLAYAYEDVMKALHNGSARSCSPTTLKRAIAMFAPRFAGCLQHDAQEFLAYLLDGLHEDLNRIRKAPYVELPDVTDGQCLAVAGAHAWDAHRRRNDSLVFDTFYGQFKSTCVCPNCNRVSVSFDAFNHVSLEIPQEKNALVPLAVIVFAAAASDETIDTAPASPILMRYGVPIRRTHRLSDLKAGLSALCGIPVSRLQLCDVYNHAICSIHPDKKSVSEIPMNRLVAYEVDPFDGPDSACTFHGIATHKLVDPLLPERSPQDRRPPEPFGCPLMTSFNASLTCREIWDHLWAIVGRMATSTDGFDAKSLLQIRLMTKSGAPNDVFPTAVKTDALSGSSDGTNTIMSSLLPYDCDETLLSFVGSEGIKNFVFLDLEWTDPSDRLDDNIEESKRVPRIDEQGYLTIKNHSSWIEAEQKFRGKSDKKGVTLDQCFETFTKPERLDEHNMWYCSSCKEHVCAMKTMELWKLPNVLIVHLKRFEFKHGLRRDKLDTLVDFPLNGLDLNVHCATPGNATFVNDRVPAIYDCFAVVNHFGRMGFGHYTAYARSWDETGISDDWALFDDSSVRNVGDGRGSVVSPAAYVLLYRRRTFN